MVSFEDLSEREKIKKEIFQSGERKLCFCKNCKRAWHVSSISISSGVVLCPVCKKKMVEVL